ncbi:hypothetical protein BGZ60DRAFT_271486 [Tricladium varicosporioides]|nr:hypothetical protein BGZ60DRAFT_271486 [Hymenoscyphus varicosporioides]
MESMALELLYTASFSMLDVSTTTSTTRCATCHERSTWDFLRDFYLRVESANDYARRLESELHEAKNTAHQSQHALTQCEAALVNSWEMLNEERLDYRASQEALSFERERHKETMDLLERVFKEAIRSGEVADCLGGKLTELQAAASCRVAQAIPQTMATTEASPSTSNLAPQEPPDSTSQQSYLAERYPESYAISSPEQKNSSLDEQEIQISVAEASDERSCGGSFTFHGQPLPSTKSTSRTSCTGGRARRSKAKLKKGVE